MLSSKAGDGTADRAKVDDITSELGGYLLTPFEDLMAITQQIIIVPSQEMNGYPFCSLPFHGRPLGLQKWLSVAPSLSILHRPYNKVQNTSSSTTASVLANRDETAVMANVSATVIAKMANSMPIVTNEMSQSEVSHAFASSRMVYFATHGERPPESLSSWQAQLLLKPGVRGSHTEQSETDAFRMIDLATMQTDAVLVVFAACVAGLGEGTHGNDMIGFSYAVLETGAKAFVGALWNASDWATLLLMQFFHELLLDPEADRSIAECLHLAQIKFQELTKLEAAHQLEQARDSVKDVRAGLSNFRKDSG